MTDVQILNKYNQLLKRLKAVRKLNHGKESQEEDNILNQMDEVWDMMSKEAREFVEVFFPTTHKEIVSRGSHG